MSHEIISFNHVLAERARQQLVIVKAEEEIEQTEQPININDYRKRLKLPDLLKSITTEIIIQLNILYLNFIGAQLPDNVVNIESFRNSSKPTA